MSDDDGNTTRGSEDELSDTRRRQGAQKLSALLRAGDDDAIRRFRKQYLRDEGTIEHEDLIAARALLEHLVRALEGEDEDWSRVARWADELVAPSEPSDAGEDALADSDEPDTQKGPRPPELHEPLPPDGALLARQDKPSPWVSWSGASASRPTSASAPPPPMPSAPPPPMPSAPPPPAQEAPRAAQDVESPPPSTTVPAVDGTRPAPGSELRSGAPLRPQRTQISEGLPDTLADVTAPPFGQRDRALPFVAPDEGQTQHLVHFSMAHGLALTLREYAALRAETDDAPQRRHLIQERYHVGESRTRELLHRAFELRFEQDAALRAQWQRHYDEFRVALRGSR